MQLKVLVKEKKGKETSWWWGCTEGSVAITVHPPRSASLEEGITFQDPVFLVYDSDWIRVWGVIYQGSHICRAIALPLNYIPSPFWNSCLWNHYTFPICCLPGLKHSGCHSGTRYFVTAWEKRLKSLPPRRTQKLDGHCTLVLTFHILVSPAAGYACLDAHRTIHWSLLEALKGKDNTSSVLFSPTSECN